MDGSPNPNPMSIDTLWNGLVRIGSTQERMAAQLSRIEMNQQDSFAALLPQLARLEEQQDKDSAQLTEICLILNELLPYARRAAQMMDKNPLGKLRAALGKNTDAAT